MGGARIVKRSLKTKRNPKKFQDRLNLFKFFKSLKNPIYLLKIVFPKFGPLTLSLEARTGKNSLNDSFKESLQSGSYHWILEKYVILASSLRIIFLKQSLCINVIVCVFFHYK